VLLQHEGFAMTVIRRLAVACLALMWMASGAAAQTPSVLYTVTGVTKVANLETAFVCTSTETVNALTLQVQLFGNDATPAGSSSPLSMTPNQTFTFLTGSVAGVLPNSIISASLGGTGSAQILSTSKKLLCTAFILDSTSSPPASMVSLPVFAKGKQKGD
jgi:hypothetical protein